MEELTKDILMELAKPFPPSRISIKVQTKPNEKTGKSLCVAYIDARDVMERLDEVVGGGWSDDYKNAPSGGLECALTVFGVTRRDVGDDENDNEQKKAAYSDAFKRAAVKFGIGRFLYDLPKMYAEVKQFGKNFYLADGEEERLQKIIFAHLNGAKPPEPRKPEQTQPAAPEKPKPAPVSDEHKRLVAEWSTSFNEVPAPMKGQAKTPNLSKATNDELRAAIEHNKNLNVKKSGDIASAEMAGDGLDPTDGLPFGDK